MTNETLEDVCFGIWLGGAVAAIMWGVGADLTFVPALLMCGALIVAFINRGIESDD